MDTTPSSTEPKKLCPGCIKNLPLYLFRNKTFCMEYVTLRGMKNAPRSSSHPRIDERLKQYGLTYISYKRRYEIQGRRCAICSELREWDGSGKLPFAVDHDHATGFVRGLLCTQCNLGLGCFKDRRDSLINAITYLDRSQRK